MSALSEVAAIKNEGPKTTTRAIAKRKSAGLPESNGTVRYFLARDGATGDVPQLGKEFARESEVLIESMRTGLNYYALSEWKALPDFSGKHPQILKQAVVPKQPHS